MYQLMRSALRLAQCHQCNTTTTTPTTIITRYLRCYRCGAENDNDELICANCAQVQQPPAIAADNYFTVFSLNASYEINIAKLTKRYRFLQKILHPGKFSKKNEEDNMILSTYSALVNKAYATLHAPLSRAQHLLALNGITITDADEHRATDANFLMQMMDLSEEVEAAVAADSLELHYLRTKNDAAIADLSASIASRFRTGHLSNVWPLVIKLKHYDTLAVRINHLLRQRGVDV